MKSRAHIERVRNNLIKARSNGEIILLPDTFNELLVNIKFV